ncbi:hypothetical protein [Streptomyces avicenniae]|uniref:hypothetical protein n=1 Tax=Streptomyces avicenniae TaxID=500153 RepID=UPI00069A4D8E|nr:hypothetical protein [Streptomyces avicenniae]
MRNVDPFEFLDRHSDTIFRWLGFLGILLIVFLLLRHLAMRQGGWRAGRARLRRETAVTAHAFAAPARAWLRHRRSLRTLTRGLRDTATWRDAERALAAARDAAAPERGRPWAVLVDATTVTVLLAGRNVSPPDRAPWWQDEDDPAGHWSAARADLPPVVPVPDRTEPVLVAIGETGGRCVLLDTATGPAMLTVEGERRSALALHQAVAAQLDARLPDGLVVVAEGVHPAFPGQPVRAAHRAVRDLPPRMGIAPVLVTSELPDPLPPELVAPPGESTGPRLVVRGPGRGHVRTLLTDRQGRVVVSGTPLLTEGNALSRAVARVLPALPPVLPPAPPSGAGAARVFAEVDDEADAAADTADAGLDARLDAPAAAVPRPPVAETDDAPEPAPAARPTPEGHARLTPLDRR